MKLPASSPTLCDVGTVSVFLAGFLASGVLLGSDFFESLVALESLVAVGVLVDAVVCCALTAPAINAIPSANPETVRSRFEILVFIPSILLMFGVPPFGGPPETRNS